MKRILRSIIDAKPEAIEKERMFNLNVRLLFSRRSCVSAFCLLQISTIACAMTGAHRRDTFNFSFCWPLARHLATR